MAKQISSKELVLKVKEVHAADGNVYDIVDHFYPELAHLREEEDDTLFEPYKKVKASLAVQMNQIRNDLRKMAMDKLKADGIVGEEAKSKAETMVKNIMPMFRERRSDEQKKQAKAELQELADMMF